MRRLYICKDEVSESEAETLQPEKQSSFKQSMNPAGWLMAAVRLGKGFVCLQQFYKCLRMNALPLKRYTQQHKNINVRLYPCRLGSLYAGADDS